MFRGGNEAWQSEGWRMCSDETSCFLLEMQLMWKYHPTPERLNFAIQLWIQFANSFFISLSFLFLIYNFKTTVCCAIQKISDLCWKLQFILAKIRPLGRSLSDWHVKWPITVCFVFRRCLGLGSSQIYDNTDLDWLKKLFTVHEFALFCVEY